MRFIMRREKPEDHRKVEKLTRAVFWDAVMPPYAGEDLLVRKLRSHPIFVPELDFVAEADGRVVGNIMYARSKVKADDGKIHESLTFGPVSVWPDWQRQGIGAALIRYTLGLARVLGFRSVLIFGHPGYYPRFGFGPAGKFGVTPPRSELVPDDLASDSFMALELLPGGLAGVSGCYVIDPVYELDPAEIAAFDPNLP